MSESIFGLAERALQLSEDRSVILSNNIVNSSTPHYQARDINYSKLIKDAGISQPAAVTESNSKHLALKNHGPQEPLLYRVPMQRSMDGNTVDEEVEHKNFIENAVHYQVNLTFIQNKTDQLMKAIKGE